MSLIKIVMLSAPDEIGDVVIFDIDDITYKELVDFVENGAINSNLNSFFKEFSVSIDSIYCKDTRKKLFCDFLKEKHKSLAYDEILFCPLY